ncbi:MAG: cytochrome P450, partial [Acidimicrobiales bacterium]|nr:cytochrome P450 [Acidimicrobiales bacterium]
MATTNFDTTTGQIDVLSNVAYIDGPPHEALAWLRANRPLHHQTIDDPIWIGESYVLTRHADVKAVSVDLENFGNGEGHNLRNDHSDDDTRHLLNSDRPKHTDLRSVMSREFTPRVVRQLGDTYANLASDAVQAVADEQSFDFVERVAVEVPMKAIVALMGAPVEDQDRILRWSNATISNIDPDYSPTPEARMEAFGEMTEYAMMLKAARDASASDDVSGLLVQAL